ncbi:hypothetical protein [Sphingobacterium sp. NPDC055431]
MIRELIGIPVYYKTKIGLLEFKVLQKYAANHLGVKSIYALRDKFEGERYYQQFLQRSFAELAFQSFLGECVFNIEQKEIKDFKPSFKLGDSIIELVDCSFEMLPKVPIGEYDVLVICFVNLTSREVWIIGKLHFEVAKK